MKRLTTALALGAALLAAAATPARAQAANPEAEVRATVRALFDAMRGGDSTALRRLFDPSARLMRAGRNREGAPVLQSQPIDGFVQAVGTPHTEVWDERISDLVVQVDGNLAQVWMNFTFYLGGQKRHCGVNAAQLFRGADGWKFFQLSDTARMADCPDLPSS
jgi:hypothetical protein